jgi:hypothetical protein
MDVYPVPAAVMQARVQLIIDQTDKAPPATINNDVADVIEVQATAQRDALLDVIRKSRTVSRAQRRTVGAFVVLSNAFDCSRTRAAARQNDGPMPEASNRLA